MKMRLDTKKIYLATLTKKLEEIQKENAILKSEIEWSRKAGR